MASKKPTPAQPNAEGFEALYKQLEETVAKLEQGNLSLEESLSLYEAGTALAKRCQELLQDAELRVTRLQSQFNENAALRVRNGSGLGTDDRRAGVRRGACGVTDAPRVIRVDCHNHTYYSPDSILSPRTMLARAKARGLNVIAVTDHYTVRGGLVAREIAAKRYPELRVIVGEEVLTTKGDLLGLFLSEDIPTGLAPGEAIDRIHSQGGIAGAPHPFDTHRSALGNVLPSIAGKLDFIEGLNARMVESKHNDMAQEFAKAHNLPMSAASDAHSPREIARCYVEMPDFETPAQFLESLRSGTLRGRLSSPMIHLISRYAKLRRALGWRPPA